MTIVMTVTVAGVAMTAVSVAVPMTRMTVARMAVARMTVVAVTMTGMAVTVAFRMVPMTVAFRMVPMTVVAVTLRVMAVAVAMSVALALGYRRRVDRLVRGGLKAQRDREADQEQYREQNRALALHRDSSWWFVWISSDRFHHHSRTCGSGPSLRAWQTTRSPNSGVDSYDGRHGR
ncbi:MAG: hypothetical protein MPN21_06085 [Thermoanaerobaculia bacterium]|nr:hypothetical protein [Thermoanaerobaculia bacterium]